MDFHVKIGAKINEDKLYSGKLYWIFPCRIAGGCNTCNIYPDVQIHWQSYTGGDGCGAAPRPQPVARRTCYFIPRPDNNIICYLLCNYHNQPTLSPARSWTATFNFRKGTCRSEECHRWLPPRLETAAIRVWTVRGKNWWWWNLHICNNFPTKRQPSIVSWASVILQCYVLLSVHPFISNQD